MDQGAVPVMVPPCQARGISTVYCYRLEKSGLAGRVCRLYSPHHQPSQPAHFSQSRVLVTGRYRSLRPTGQEKEGTGKDSLRY